jgi:AsmA protein
MTAEGDRRRPLVAAFVALAAISLALIVPLLVGGPGSDPAFTGAYVRAASHDSFTLSAPVTLIDAPRVVLEKGTISLAAGKDGTVGSGAALSSLLTGGGADLILDGATLVLDRTLPIDGADGSATLFAEAMGPMVTALAARKFGTLLLRNATVVIKTPSGAEETLHSVTGEIRSKRETSLEAKGTFRLRGEELAFDVASAASLGKKDAPVAVRASIRSRLLDASFEGRFVRGERLQIASPHAKLTVPKLREAARWLGADWPEGQQGLGAFEAEGPLDWSEGSLSFENAHFTLDGNAATGALSLTLGGDRPNIEGTLAFNSLNLAPYLEAPAAPATRKLATDWLSLIRIPGTLSSSLIREMDADVRISARSVAVADQTLGRCAATLSIKDGKLFADLAEIELDHGGTGDGQVGVDMTGGEPRYSIRGRLESFDVGKMVGQRFGRTALEGFGTVDVDLAGEGDTEAAVLASLSGKVEVDMPEGARLGLNVEGLAAAAGAASQPGIWGAAAEGATAVDSFVAKFAATGGVFTAEAVKADTGAKVVTAEGTVSVAERELDVTVSIAGEPAGKAAATPGTGGPAPSEGFRVQGSWAAPTVSPVYLLPLTQDPHPAPQPVPAEFRPSGDRG